MVLEDLNIKYDKLQKKYGDKSLHSIYNGGCTNNPDICFVFMNPTGRNIASSPDWDGPHSPWLGTKNIWNLFYQTNLFNEELYNLIKSKKSSEWDKDFCNEVYNEVSNNKFFITNLAKCTQVDARPLNDSVFKEYLKLLEKEIDIIKPKVIVLFGNQVSSIFLNEKISVSTCRKKLFNKKIGKNTYKCYSVYYPVGNGIFNIDKSIEDIKWIINKEVK